MDTLDDTLAVNIAHFLKFVKQIYLNERMLNKVNITSDSCHFLVICTLPFAEGHLCYKYRQSTGKLVGPTINKLFIPCFFSYFFRQHRYKQTIKHLHRFAFTQKDHTNE
jgi:hypothetical protein